MTRVNDSHRSVECPPLENEFTILLTRCSRILVAETFVGIPYIFELQGPGLLLRCQTHKMSPDEQAYWAARQALKSASAT